MAGSLGSLVVSLTAETAQFRASLDKAAYQAEKNFAKISSTAKTAVGALAAFAGAQSFVGFIKSQIDMQDALFKTSQKIGIGVEELSKLTYAAKLADVDTAQLQTGLVKLSKGMAETANGTGDAMKAFAAMGISVQNGDGTLKSSAQVLGEIADKFSTYEDGANKTALATNLFGRSGAELIPLLNGGSAAIKEAGDELERFGAVVSESAAKNAEMFNDNLTRLSTLAGGVGKELANAVIPYINQLAQEFLIARANGIGFMDMLSMGTRFGDYSEQLQKIEKEIENVQKAWSFPIGATREERLASLERQKKTLQQLQGVAQKTTDAVDAVSGAGKKTDEKKKQAPLPFDAEKYKKGLEDARQTNRDFASSMEEMFKMRTQTFENPFMTEEQKKLQEDYANVQSKFISAQEKIKKQFADGKITQQDYQNQLMSLGVTYEEAIFKAQELYDKQIQLNGSYEYGATTAIQKYIQESQNLAKQTENVVSNALGGLENALVGITMRTTTVSEAFKNMATSILSDIVRMTVKQQISAPLAAMLGKGIQGLFPQTGTGGGGFMDTIGSVFGGLFGGGKAMGGQVNAGTSYLVGEKGAEVFTPATNGVITPNGALGGSTNVVVNVNMSENTTTAQEGNMLGILIGNVVKGELIKQKRPGGLLA